MIKETENEYMVNFEVYIEEMNRYDYIVYLDKTLDGPSGPEEAYRMAAAIAKEGGGELVEVEYGVSGEEGMYSSFGNNFQINYRLEFLNKELYGYQMAVDCLLNTEDNDVKSAMVKRVNDLKDKIEQLELACDFNTEENT